jgi:hypothetical protein
MPVAVGVVAAIARLLLRIGEASDATQNEDADYNGCCGLGCGGRSAHDRQDRRQPLKIGLALTVPQAGIQQTNSFVGHWRAQTQRRDRGKASASATQS